MEVATLIAEKLGVEPEFIEGEWDGLLAGLDAGRYDIMVNGVDITEERAEKYDFSDMKCVRQVIAKLPSNNWKFNRPT